MLGHWKKDPYLLKIDTVLEKFLEIRTRGVREIKSIIEEIMMNALKGLIQVTYIDLHLFIEIFKTLKIFLKRLIH